MQKPFITVVALGAALGLFWPSAHSSAPATRTPTAAAPGEFRSGPPRETLLKRAPNGHFYTDVEVNGELVHAVVDTGATDVALTIEDARRLGISFSESDFRPIGEGASGVIRGTEVVLQRVALDGKEVRAESDGNGPVDASLKAIESYVKSGAEMVLYSVNAISGSTESQGEVTEGFHEGLPERSEGVGGENEAQPSASDRNSSVT